MDIGYLTSDAAKYSSKSLKKVLILGILFLISFLIVPAFLSMGYLFRVLKLSIDGVDNLPDFERWGEMFVDGLKVFVVQLTYFIIPFAFIFIGLWTSITSLMALQDAGSTMNPTFSLSLTWGLIFLGLAMAVIFGAFFTIALANMAYYDGEIMAAFRFKEILDTISNISWVDFIVWYVVMITIGLSMLVTAIIIGLIPILGLIISILAIYPYINLLFARALGLLFLSSFENQNKKNNHKIT